MTTNNERITRLQSYGLTENQAKAYLALLELGRATASALNKVSGVPRNKVYSVVEELNEKGLVDIVLEDPIVFEPRPLAHYLDLLINELESKTSDLARRKQDLAEEFRIQRRLSEEDLQVGSFRLFKGRRAIIQQHARMHREARRSLRVLASPATPARWLAAGSLDEPPSLPDVPRAEIELFTPLNKENRKAVEAVHSRLGDHLRVVYDTPDNVVIQIVDDRAVMFTHFVPDSDSVTSGDDIGIWTDNPVFLRLARDRVHSAAVRSENLETAIERLAGDRAGLPPQYEVIRDAEEARRLGYELLNRSSHADIVLDVDMLMPCVEGWLRDGGQSRSNLDRLRIITDADPARIADDLFGDGIEIRHISPLPARFSLFDERLVRSYRVDPGEAAMNVDAGIVTVSTNLESALEEARDHFDRMWESAEPVEPRETPMVPGRVAEGESLTGARRARV